MARQSLHKDLSNRPNGSPLSRFEDGPADYSVTATEAKNEFGRILERVIRGGRVHITKHDARKAVLVSAEEFDALSRSTAAQLDHLTGEFDALLARMQAPGAHTKMKTAFNASPKRLGRAAVRAAKKRG
jgi:antitoxin Phd